jgi:hypothetical protein
MSLKRFIKIFTFFFVVLFFLCLFLFIGVYEDDEFSYNTIFIKHRPSFHFYYYNPQSIGENRTFESLSEKEKYEKLLYDEFVEKNNGFKRSLSIPFWH